ncbi:hypothetical protein QUF56_13140 [Ureibacillus composti]|nr:hypothetical protein [Ureibacillus composti]HWJ80362.1 hypothetical protein [Niallia sp.]
MKVNRDLLLLEESIKNGDLAQARRIIELNMMHFKTPRIRNQLSIEALTLLNMVVQFNDSSTNEIYSRKTQLIIGYINNLARKGHLTSLKHYASFHDELLSNPKIYNLLNADAKIFIAPPNQKD